MTKSTLYTPGRLDARPWPATVLLYGLLLLCTVITLLPFAWMLSSSFKPTVEIFSGTAQLIPANPILDNYVNAVTRQPVARAIFNSILVAGIETFAVNQWVDVIGTTKGRGFQGAVKRHGFGGLKQTHGSMMHRRTGAIGCRSTPGRVWKNQKMPGHMGDVPRTIQNLKIVAVRPEDGVILVSGAVPGAKGGYLTIRASKKKINNPIYTARVETSAKAGK